MNPEKESSSIRIYLLATKSFTIVATRLGFAPDRNGNSKPWTLFPSDHPFWNARRSPKVFERTCRNELISYLAMLRCLI